MKLLAPNGKPSNLTPEQYKLVRTPEFKAWFGDWEKAYQTGNYDNVSKVIDEDTKEPLVCYHATKNDFYVFKEAKNTIGVYGKGFYFGNSKGYVSVYNRGENQKVLSVFLKIKNPIIIKNDVLPIGYENYYSMMGGYDSQGNPLESNKGTSQAFTNKAKSENYDGVFAEITYRDKEFVVFEPTQIKLADGTNTTFDSNNPDIRFKNGGNVESNELDKIKERYDLGSEYYESEIYGQPFKIRMNKNHPRNSYRNDDQSIHNLSLVNVKYPSAVLFREDNDKLQWQYDEIYDWEDAEKSIKSFFYEIKDKSEQFAEGGNLSKTPAPKKDRIYGSKKNKPKSSESKSKASSIILSPTVIKSINTIIKEHNKEYPNKKVPISTAKAVVRRGMGAYSSTHRPTIRGGKPNSRVAWGLARLNAFIYKIQKGHSKSGKYSQDNDLIGELGYKVSKFDNGGGLDSLYKDHHNVWAESEKIIKDVCEENCSKYSNKIYNLYELELKPHFEEEENDFFPKVVNETNKQAIDDLIKEHKTIAYLCKKIRLHQRTADIKDFCKLIKNHIKKEEEIMNQITPDPYKKEENKDYKYFLVLKNKKPIFKVRFSKYNKETEKDMSLMLDKLSDMNYILKLISEKEYNEFDYKNVNKEDVAEFTRKWTIFKEGGVISDEQEETYKKWKKLVNMSSSELQKFLDSEEGKIAGLTKEEADDLGIDYGRESAKWILKMKATPYKEWTPNMWRWANKQISFISRMTGNKGKLYKDGKKTRKYLSLLVWGNNPLKK